MKSIPDYRYKIVIPIVHRREPRSFQLVVYGLTVENWHSWAGRDAIYDKLQRRGFSVQDWGPVWSAIHAEQPDYRWLGFGAKLPRARGVYDA
jgi:hypothetical protein